MLCMLIVCSHSFSNYVHKIVIAYCLTFSQACFCRLCYFMSSSLCALPQHVCVLLLLVRDTRDTYSWHSCFSCRRSLSLLCILRQLAYLNRYFQFQIFDYGRYDLLVVWIMINHFRVCLLYTSPSPRDS